MTDVDILEGLDPLVRDAVTIEPMAIQEEFIAVPAHLAYWNSQYAAAFESHIMHKLAREQMYRALYGAYHAQLVSERGGKAPTISDVDSRVEPDSRMVEARREEALAEAEKVRLQGICEAVRAKRDMVISLGAHMRAEMAGNPLIRS